MTTDVEQLSFYLAAGYELIPLHKWNSRTTMQNGVVMEDGKRPLHLGWSRLQYRQQDMIEHMRSGYNLGVRLRRTELVIDVDPRKFPKGVNVWEQFCSDLGQNWVGCPTVATGGGGIHVYLTKPDTINIRNSLEAYQGLEFKSRGAQVVAAGSIHPQTEQMYRWQTQGAGPEAIPQAPKALLNLIKWAAPVSAVGGGEYSAEQLAQMLSGLDPADFREYDRWLQVLMASHHATAGEGRFAFIEWSTCDLKYCDHAENIGRKWDSFHGGVHSVTVLSLFRLLRLAGRADLLPAAATAKDFDDLDASQYPQIIQEIGGIDTINETSGFDDKAESSGGADNVSVESGSVIQESQQGGEEEERSISSILERMNRKYCTVLEGSTLKIAFKIEDPTMADAKMGIPARSRWVFLNHQAFVHDLSHVKLQSAEGKSIPITRAWMEYPKRRRYQGAIFSPEADYQGFLNLWAGWAYQPNSNGSWRYLQELLTDVLCDGDTSVFDYVMKWSAFYVQNPGTPAEVAICFQGGKGVGKGTFGRVLANLAGRHGLQVTQPSQLTGKFNGHLRDTVLLFADEVIGCRDRESEAQLKALITEPTFSAEAKGVDIQQVKNCLHIVMASNDDWFVPAGLENERRFVVQRANDSWRGNHQKFAKLYEELKKGGYAALLHDLMVFPLEDWHPRMNMPKTEAAVDQKLRNMTPIEQWWFGILNCTEYPFPIYPHTDGRAVFKQDIRQNYADFCASIGIKVQRGRSNDIVFARDWRRLLPEGAFNPDRRLKAPEDRPDLTRAGDGYARIYILPSMEDSRKFIENKLGGVVTWG